MGWLEIPIDPLSVILPTLLFVVGFTDSVHMVHDIRASLAIGKGTREAACDAVRRIGPACVITALTTMAGFGSLLAARTQCIQRFGGMCALGTAITVLAIQMVVPLLAASSLGAGLPHSVPSKSQTNHKKSLAHRIYGRLLGRPRLIATASVAFTLFCFLTSLQLRSDLKWMESLPHDSEIAEVTRSCDQALGGALFAYIVMEWPKGSDLQSPGVLDAIRELHTIAESASDLRGPSSVAKLLDSLQWRDQTAIDQVKHLRRIPPEVLTQFIQPEIRKAMISIHVPDVGAAALSPQFAMIDGRLEGFVAKHPGYRAHLTGTVIVAARNVYRIIEDLGRSLSLASGVIFVMMVVLFRSLFLGLLSIIPNVFPQAITASLLVWMDEPLNITSVLTFSLCLGLSVDDTVHFLMRFIEERRLQGSLEAVQRTFEAVGTTMIATSLVLIGGFAAMTVSNMPGVRWFAILSCITLVAALLGDLLMLPSLLLSFASWSRRRVAMGPQNNSQLQEQQA